MTTLTGGDAARWNIRSRFAMAVRASPTAPTGPGKNYHELRRAELRCQTLRFSRRVGKGQFCRGMREMSLSDEQVRKVASLARLQLDDEELASMREHLASILDYIEQLRELPTEGVEPLAHPLPLQNVFRDDIVRPSLPVDEALANAPRRTEDFYGVPAILDDV